MALIRSGPTCRRLIRVCNPNNSGARSLDPTGAPPEHLPARQHPQRAFTWSRSVHAVPACRHVLARAARGIRTGVALRVADALVPAFLNHTLNLSYTS